MIGRVTQHHALLKVTFRTIGLPDVDVECVIDTGFTGYATLPRQLIAAMNVPFLRSMPVNLADDSTVMVDVHAAGIVWNGDVFELEVIATGTRPLIGTLLLEGSLLSVQFSEGGTVHVELL